MIRQSRSLSGRSFSARADRLSSQRKARRPSRRRRILRLQRAAVQVSRCRVFVCVRACVCARMCVKLSISVCFCPSLSLSFSLSLSLSLFLSLSLSLALSACSNYDRHGNDAVEYHAAARLLLGAGGRGGGTGHNTAALGRTACAGCRALQVS